ncbi:MULTISPECIES: hypothetical protein [unclassified Rhizobium]|uniref:hypothetical protein n=1 Tax=unclassified Rhizobium TaxID=2613769 RepID=UPI001ADBF6BE|nr:MULTISPECIES: hypothetical protein [unclassified Rhizobium]MBO9100017.1 hypothetical protein [Rhizobium sp. L58/93]QXZ82827.1 hypothetical protein J5287_12130 [Rhizobium sp. K1/93]QXZ89660.1 hypothetical protein J5280_16460 [Rhizobium sp. K15/93]
MSEESAQLVAIRKVIEDTLASDFKNVKILRVMVDRDVDFDGDHVLNVEVVFEGKPLHIDARMISGAIRHVRPHLEKLGEKAFPLMSFVSRRDASNMGMALGSL